MLRLKWTFQHMNVLKLKVHVSIYYLIQRFVYMFLWKLIYWIWVFFRLSLGELSITSLFIPGTHNSACYLRGNSLSQRDTIGRYLLTQDQDVWSQLVYGIRYIDLRVGIYPIRRSNGSEEISNENV